MFSFFNQLKISQKLSVLVAFFFVTIVAGVVFDQVESKHELLAEKKLKTRHLVEAAHSVIQGFYDLQAKGLMPEEDARKAAMQAVKSMRYEGKEYFWINDLARPVPNMVMHPLLPALDGKVLDDKKFERATSMQAGLSGVIEPTDSKKNLFVAFVDVAEKAGEGYVTYVWNKPKAGGGATDELFPKLSYVKRFEPWGWVVGSGIYVDDVDAHFASELKSRLALFVVVFLLLAILSFVIYRAIIGPIDRVAFAMRDIAEGGGDLTRRLKGESRGSLAHLADSFNVFADKIETAIVQVNDCSVQLTETSSQVLAVAEQTAAGVRQQKEDSERLHQTVSEMAGKVAAVAGKAEEAACAADKADREALSGQQMVGKTMQIIHQLASDVENAGGVIHRLQKESASIGSIVDVIREIADQTNLLALNAAIEAARAGEEGRGFAVVADEVRVLANRTQEATREIQRMIDSIQQGAKEAANVMVSGQERAHSCVGQAGEASTSLESITEAVSSIASANRDIASDSTEQSRIADAVNEGISHIEIVAEENEAGARDAQLAVSRMVDQVKRLESMVKQFRFSC